MIIEAQIEEKLKTEFSRIIELADTQIIASRSNKKTEESYAKTVVAIASGFRTNDAFSLSLITIPISITIVTRVEGDSSGVAHNAIVESIVDVLSYWHKYGNEMEAKISSNQFLAGELRMDGGTTQIYDKENGLWMDTLNISIRGAEKFTS